MNNILRVIRVISLNMAAYVVTSDSLSAPIVVDLSRLFG